METPSPTNREEQPFFLPQVVPAMEETDPSVVGSDPTVTESGPDIPDSDPTCTMTESGPSIPEGDHDTTKSYLPKSDAAMTESDPTLFESDAAMTESDPTIPESDPTIPVSDPTIPEYDPTVPEADSAVPESDPTIPVSDPTIPESDSAVPESDPTTTESIPVINSAPAVAKIQSGLRSGPRCDVSTIIDDLSLYADEEHHDWLTFIQLGFTCLLCKEEKDTLKELMLHLQNDKCTVKRGPGRPRKYPRLPGVAKQEYPRYPPWKDPKTKILESTEPSRRTTRISTGSIPRRNTPQLMGIKPDRPGLNKRLPAVEVLEDDKALVPREKTGVIKGINPEIVLNIEHLLQAANQMKQEEEANAHGPVWSMITEDPIGTEDVAYIQEVDQEATQPPEDVKISEDTTDGNEMIWEVTEPNDTTDKEEEEAQTQELISKYKSTALKQKVSLVTCPKLNLIPVSSASMPNGANIRPVITIKSEEPGGNIIIPTKMSSGESKNVVIPHTLLLQALKEHTSEPVQQSIVMIDDPNQVQSRQNRIFVKTEPSEDDQPDTDTMDDPDGDPDFMFDDDGNDDGDDGENDNDDNDEDYEEKPRPQKSKIKGLFKRGRPSKTHSAPKPVRYKCVICAHRGFNTAKELALHKPMHLYTLEEVTSAPHNDKLTKRDIFKCGECSMELRNWNRMLRHMLVHETYREQLKDTTSVKNIYGSFKCPKCDKTFDMRFNMSQHWRYVHNTKMRKCSVCDSKLYCDHKTFKRHEDICKDVEYKCDQCSYSTKVQVNLNKHTRIHTGRGVTCDICSKIFPTRQRHDAHKIRHNPSRTRYSCKACSRLFLTVDALKKHFSRFHLASANTYPCTKCPYVARVATDLPKHDKLVHNKKLKCEHEGCTYMTNSEANYNQHRTYHGPDRTFPCPYTNCYYSGTTQKQLYDHSSAVHHITSKHQCPICQHFYKKKVHLLRHLVSHTGDQPYHCLECGRSFYSHSTYYRHRAKTGHDAKREGIASIPQNIQLTYIEADGTTEGTVDVRSSKPLAAKKGKNAYDESVASIQNLLLQSEIIYPPDASMPMDIASAQGGVSVQELVQDTGNGEVVFIETTETQLVEELDNLQQFSMGQPITIEPTTLLQNNTNQEQVIFDLQSVDGGVHQEALQSVVTIPGGGGDTAQYTYILSEQETQAMIGGSQVTLDIPHSTVSMDALPTDADPGMVGGSFYRSDEMPGLATMVEVAPTGGSKDGQYAILLVPSETQEEPEAALSMLQLQSSL